jgi:V8-like Glu-specific endopeptidase
VVSRLKFSLTLAICGVLAAGAAQPAAAQSSTTLQSFYAIGLEHAMSHPYNYTGRVFINDDAETAIASGTLIRRHTVLTAGHVVYDPTAGFATSLSFSRGRYGNYALSDQQGTAVNVLAGYQAAVTANTAGGDTETLEEAEVDLGYILITDPPVDSSWGNYLADPTQLTNNDGRFILGYPGVTFDGRTMAYVVPTAPFVQIGLTETGGYSNELIIVEGGFSGGPVYAVVNGEQVVVAELTSGNDDTTGEFNATFVRAIDTTAAKFLQDAEYLNGLIKKVKIAGPATAKRGVKHTYTLTVKFTEPNVNGSAATTNRYPELKLKSDTPGTAADPLTTITKISNSQFQVTFSTQLRPGSTVNLTGYYDKDMPAPGSTLAVVLE